MKSLLFALLLCLALPAHSQTNARLKVLVITGGHGFEKEPFFKIFEENPAIEWTAASQGKTAEAYEREDLLSYDVVVLYDMPKQITEPQKVRMAALFEKGTGLVVLHHALVSYQDWQEYEALIGGRYSTSDEKAGAAGYQHDVDMPVHIVDPAHPITAGMADFVIRDEIYWGFKVRSDVTPLLTTTQPQSGNPIAWYRSQEKSRVIYLQLGHGPSAYNDANYRLLVGRAIQWAGKR